MMFDTCQAKTDGTGIAKYQNVSLMYKAITEV